MHSPHSWWNELSVFWKIVTSVVGGLATVTAAWAPLSKSWRWAVARYDRPIFTVLEGRKRIEWLTANPTPTVMPPVSVTFVAHVVNRKPKSVLKSLERLERHGKAHQGPFGWSWGPRNLEPVKDSPGRFNRSRFNR